MDIHPPRRFWWYVLIAIIVIITIKLAFARGFDNNHINISKQEKTLCLEQNKADFIIKNWIDKLEWYESQNNEDIIIIDTNGKKSFGCLQFQKETFIRQVKKYNILPKAEEQEIMNLILDCKLQKKLAFEMIKHNPDNWKHWRTSVVKKKLGKPPLQ